MFSSFTLLHSGQYAYTHTHLFRFAVTYILSLTNLLSYSNFNTCNRSIKTNRFYQLLTYILIFRGRLRFPLHFLSSTTCPYDPSHKISAKKFQTHITSQIQLEICPFNSQHRIEKHVYLIIWLNVQIILTYFLKYKSL